MWFTRFSAPVLVLIWTAYYFAERCTGGLVDIVNILVCGAVSKERQLGLGTGRENSGTGRSDSTAEVCSNVTSDD